MNAAQVLDHFDRISDAPDAIPRLRRFILDLAVRGKLVEQDPNDEPASELLQFSTRVPRERPSNLPVAWIEAAVGKLLNFQYGKALPSSERLNSGRVRVFGSNGVVGYCNKTLVEEPAIIIGRKGSAGALNLCEGPILDNGCCVFRFTTLILCNSFLVHRSSNARSRQIG